MRLDDKSALVAGGGTGIGSATAHIFAQQGCRVAISGRREDKLKAVCEESAGSQFMCYRSADVGDIAQVTELIEWCNHELGQIDILVNSAGVNVADRSLKELTPESWDYIMQVNSTGAFNLIHAVLPQMRARKDGVIISISSIAGLRASILGGAAYSASKFAMRAVTNLVSLEERDNGIRATVISPGEVDTPILE